MSQNSPMTCPRSSHTVCESHNWYLVERHFKPRLVHAFNYPTVMLQEKWQDFCLVQCRSIHFFLLIKLRNFRQNDKKPTTWYKESFLMTMSGNSGF